MLHGNKADQIGNHPDSLCTMGQPPTTQGQAFKAYAIGDIYDDDGDSAARKWDKWYITEEGVLEHCQNPLIDKTDCP